MPGSGRRKLRQVTEHQEECLNILQEECAEVIQAASKIKRFGLVGKRIDTISNLKHIETELGDVLAMIDLVRDSGLGLNAEGIEQARKDKLERLSKYMHTWDETSR
jgi:NTP pyrophosphatase (non-canonical NTP hydrolase)